jgi:hypothetical protein
LTKRFNGCIIQDREVNKVAEIFVPTILGDFDRSIGKDTHEKVSE